MEEKGNEKDKSERKKEASPIIADPKLEKTVELKEKPRNKITINIKKEDLDDRQR